MDFFPPLDLMFCHQRAPKVTAQNGQTTHKKIISCVKITSMFLSQLTFLANVRQLKTAHLFFLLRRSFIYLQPQKLSSAPDLRILWHF